MKKLIFRSAFLSLALITGPLTYADSEDLVDYDQIISDLKGSTESKLPEVSTDPFDNVMLHAGVGLATSYIRVRPELGKSHSGFLTGVEANFGIDLFSKNWQAETSLRSFNSEQFTPDLNVSLKEFDLKIMNTQPVAGKLKLRLGAGLAARYMNVSSPQAKQTEYTTPASIFDGALRAQITPNIGIGGELSLRTALISESIDRSAMNAAIRLDAQF